MVHSRRKCVYMQRVRTEKREGRRERDKPEKQKKKQRRQITATTVVPPPPARDEVATTARMDQEHV